MVVPRFGDQQYPLYLLAGQSRESQSLSFSIVLVLYHHQWVNQLTLSQRKDGSFEKPLSEVAHISVNSGRRPDGRSWLLIGFLTFTTHLSTLSCNKTKRAITVKVE